MIRTPGTVTGSVVFKTTAIDHSAIPPRASFYAENRELSVTGLVTVVNPGLEKQPHVRRTNFFRTTLAMR